MSLSVSIGVWILPDYQIRQSINSIRMSFEAISRLDSIGNQLSYVAQYPCILFIPLTPPSANPRNPKRLSKSPPPVIQLQQEEPLSESATHWTDGSYSFPSLPLSANAVLFHTLPRAQPAPPPPPPSHPSSESERDRKREIEVAGNAHAARVRQAHRSEVGSSPSSPPRPGCSLRRPATLPHFSPVPSPFPPPHTSPAPSSSVYPIPDPPTILAHTVSPGPFLSHAPPPLDSWIEVETSTGEYRLVVRLPGFRRDGITLSTKRNRVLHVVADSWEGSGGHFERRISFGYDADLVQVRAEFDGEMLRISVPRRLPPADPWAPVRPGPIGRAG
ncbi:hypothetical protein DXG01_014043 [Tephrocybe rancida]|nr:hypothetical protein DXG01_014043 [Tephrocybe rancida]